MSARRPRDALCALCVLCACFMNATMQPTVCPAGYAAVSLQSQQLTDALCVRADTASPRGARDARAQCNAGRATLLSLFGLSRNAAFLLKTTLQKSGVEKAWLGMRLIQGKLVWTGETVHPVFQDDRFPTWEWSPDNAYGEKKECVYFSLPGPNAPAPFMLTLEHCDAELPFVCMSTGLDTQLQSVSWCDRQWLSSPDDPRCLLFSPAKTSHRASREQCREAGARMVQPRTQVQLQMLVNLLLQEPRAIEQSSSSRVSCYVCSLSPSVTCIQNEKLEVCDVGQVCETRSSLSQPDRRLMLQKRCASPVPCATDAERSSGSCRPPQEEEFPKCVQCCDGSGCNEGMPKNQLVESLGIQRDGLSCLACEGRDKDSCLELSRVESCADKLGAAAEVTCITKWSTDSDGNRQLMLGCVTKRQCAATLRLAQQTCTRRSSRPTCAYCCDFEDSCNSNISPLDDLLRAPSQPRKGGSSGGDRRGGRGGGGGGGGGSSEPPPPRQKRSRRTRQVASEPTRAIWVGVRYGSGQLTWLDGTPLRENHPLRTRTIQRSEGCGVVRVTDSGDVRLSLESCDRQFPTVCVQPARPGRAEILEHPQNVSTTAQAFLNEVSTNGQSNAGFRCKVENVHPGKEVTWIKDGATFLSSGRPPAGLQLQFDRDTVNRLGDVDVQGIYQCQVWSVQPYRRVVSSKAMLTFSDVVSFLGRLEVPTARADPLVFAYESTGTTRAAAALLEPLQSLIVGVTSAPLQRLKVAASVSFTRVRGPIPTVVEFWLRYRLPAGDLRSVLTALSLTTTATSRLSQRQVLERLEAAMLSTVLETTRETLSDPASRWANQVQGYGIQPRHFTLRSTVACPARETRSQRDGAALHWPRVAAGSEGRTRNVCLADGVPLATAPCLGGGDRPALWGPETLYQRCREAPTSEVSDELNSLSEADVTTDTLDKTVTDLERLTTNPNILTSTDLIYVSNVLNKIVRTRGISTRLSRRVVRVASNVLSAEPGAIEAAQRIDRAQTRLVRALERFSMRANLEGQQENRVVTTNVAMEVFALRRNSNVPVVRGFGSATAQLTNDTVFGITSIADLDPNATDMAIFFPNEVLQIADNLEGSLQNLERLPNVEATSADLAGVDVRLTYFIYRRGDLFAGASQLDASTPTFRAPNSGVISGAVSGLYIHDLTEPVVTVFKPLQTTGPNSSVCVYWDFDANAGSGDWRSDGCRSNGTVHGRVVCLCSHLTNFAILTDWDQGGGISSKHYEILSLITIIGLCLSIGGLAMTILSFVLFRKLRKGRSQKVLVNLALALLCLNVVFLVGIERTDVFTGCVVVAALLHFFLLAAFGWMLVVGVLQYLKFVKVLDTYIEHFMWKAGVPAWGIPAVVVGVLAGVKHEWYRGPENYCWLDQPLFLYAFMVPVGAVILINTILFSLVIKGISCDRPHNIRSNQNDGDIAAQQARAAVCCFVILGITWIFGFLAVDRASLVFQYLFCIFNALQGFLIFITHTLREPAVRRAWRGLCCKGDRKHKYSSTSESNTYSTGEKSGSSAHKSGDVHLDRMQNGGSRMHSGRPRMRSDRSM